MLISLKSESDVLRLDDDQITCQCDFTVGDLIEALYEHEPQLLVTLDVRVTQYNTELPKETRLADVRKQGATQLRIERRECVLEVPNAVDDIWANAISRVSRIRERQLSS